MKGRKSPLASKGVWGGLVATVVGIASTLAGWDVDAETMVNVVNNVEGLLGSFGGLLGIYGRLTAEKTLL